MDHGQITVYSISDPTGTTAPSAGVNGNLGRLALDNDTIQSISSIPGSGKDLEIEISGYYISQSTPGYIRFSPIIALTVSLNGGGTYEIGQTISSVSLTWTYNNGNVNPDTSQSLNQGIGSLPVSQRSYLYSTPTTTNKTFTITGIDSIKGTAVGSTSVLFGKKYYYGVTSSSIMTALDITGGSSVLTTSTNPDFDTTFNCTGGRYFWYAYPSVWGNLSQSNTKVNGLSFSSWSDNSGNETISGFSLSVTNAYGNTETYKVYRCYYLQNGSSISVQFRD